MCSLNDFPDFIVEDEIPSCEINGKLHYSKAGDCDIHIFTSKFSSHPFISIINERLCAPASKEHSRDIFLPISDKLTDRLKTAWYENGLTKALEVLSTCEEYTRCKTWAQRLLYTIDLLGKIVETMKFYKTPDNKEGIEKQLKEGVIQMLSWHPYCTKIAVLSNDDSIHIFSSHNQITPLIKGKNQKNVSCLAWRPLSGSDLAVGCEEGVFIWSVGEANTIISRPSINAAVHLSAVNHQNISSIAWHSHGELLATGSRTIGLIWVWSVDRREHVLFNKLETNATRLITWSPDGSKLLAATYTNVFRLWDCEKKWDYEKWRGVGCSVVAAGFCPFSTFLVFASASEPFLYCLDSSLQEPVFQCKLEKAQAKIVADLTQIELPCGTIVGGLVEELAWDNKGQHLALTFRNSPLIAVFLSVFSPYFHLVPRFFIYGEQGEKPTCMAFENDFCDGANLTIAWSSGRVQYFPIINDVEDSRHLIVRLNSPQKKNLSSFLFHSF